MSTASKPIAAARAPTARAVKWASQLRSEAAILSLHALAARTLPERTRLEGEAARLLGKAATLAPWPAAPSA